MPKKDPEGFRNVRLNADPENPAPFPPYLPLDVFDDGEFDCRTPQEWLDLGLEGNVRKPVPGRALLPISNEAIKCKYSKCISLILFHSNEI